MTKKLVEWIKETKVNQAKVAKVAKVKPTYISQLDSQLIHRASKTKALALLSALNQLRREKNLPLLDLADITEFQPDNLRDDTDKVEGESYKDVRNRRRRLKRRRESALKGVTKGRPTSYWRSSPQRLATYRLLRLFTATTNSYSGTVQSDSNQQSQRKFKTTAKQYLDTALSSKGENSEAQQEPQGFTLVLGEAGQSNRKYVSVEFISTEDTDNKTLANTAATKPELVLRLGTINDSEQSGNNSGQQSIILAEQVLSLEESHQFSLLLLKYLAERTSNQH